MENDEKVSSWVDIKIPTVFAMTILITITIFTGILLWSVGRVPSGSFNVASPGKSDGVAQCNMEAKICPDGSAVGRTGPNCEFSPCPSPKNEDMVGNDRDEHGCIPSAGYTWCEEKQKCLRIWEESCIKSKSLKGFCGKSTYDSCKNDDDCVKGGCSGQICSGKDSNSGGVTTCEYRDCYDGNSFGLSCGCSGGKCQWQ